MEPIIALFDQIPALIAGGDLIPALLLTGAGTTIFLMADNGMQGFSVFNGLFVLVGYAAGAIITFLGLFMLWDLFGPAVAVPAATGG